MIFSLGSNGSGQLGLYHADDTVIPSKVDFPDSETVTSFAAGGNHTLLLTEHGNVYASGENSDGRCNLKSGLEANSQDSTRFRSMDQLPGGEATPRWRFCSATWEASTLCSEKSLVFTCGVGSRGELGQGEGVATSPVPRVIQDFPPPGLAVVDMAACMNHTVVVTSNGDVYGWGSGRNGQIGLPPVDCWSPRKIDNLPFKAKRAFCGRDFTYIVGSPDTGVHLVLGNDKWHVKSNAPESIPHWKQIEASWGSIFVLFHSGKLLSWGRNDHRQLAPASLPPINMIAAGSEHALALSKSGNVLAWGWGEHGNCGRPAESNGDVGYSWNVLDVPGKPVSIQAGCATSWIISDDV